MMVGRAPHGHTTEIRQPIETTTKTQMCTRYNGKMIVIPYIVNTTLLQDANDSHAHNSFPFQHFLAVKPKNFFNVFFVTGYLFFNISDHSFYFFVVH